MAQPQAYNREVDFTERDGDDTNHSGVNTELDAAALSINEIRDNLALIQKDDGGLQNGIVTADSLAPSAFDAVAGQLNEAVNDAQDAASAATLAATTALGARDTAVASASAASISEANAAASAAGAATAAQTIFNGLYLGAQATDPALDLNGQPLNTGDFYYNSTAKLFRAYDAAIPGFTSATPSGQFKRPKYVAGVDFTAGVTTALTLASDPITAKNIFVFFDGVAQHNDQFSLSGTTLTFTSAIPVGVSAVEVAYIEVIGQYELFDESVTDAKIAPDADIQSSKLEYDGGTVQTVLDDAKPLQSYTALRAYTGRATGVRITTTGIAGHFYRDASDTTSADNGGTIIVDASGRRWKRLFVGEVNVKWFGAIGNNIADDTVPFQAALLTGMNVFVPDGIYKLTSAVKLQTNGQALYGNGTFTSELVWYGSSGNMLEVMSGRRDTGISNASKTGMRLSGFKLKAATGSTIESLLHVEDGVFHSYIEKIRVSSDFGAVPSAAVIKMEGGGVRQSYSVGVTFRDISIYGGGVVGTPIPCGMWVEAAIEALFDNVKVFNCEETWRLGTGDADRVSNVANCTFVKCHGEIGDRNSVSDNGAALRIFQGRELDFYGCKFPAGTNFASATNQNAVRFSTQSATGATSPFQGRDINFTSCVFWGMEKCSIGLKFDSTAFYQNVTFTDCNFYGFPTDVIDVQTDQVPLIRGLETCHYVEAEPKWNARFQTESSWLIAGFTVNNAAGTQKTLQQSSDTAQYARAEPLLVGSNVSLAGLMASAYKSNLSDVVVRIYNRSGAGITLADSYFYTRAFKQSEIQSKNSVAYNPPSLATGASSSPNIPLCGAALGDFVAVGFGNSVDGNLSNMNLFGYVSGANQVTAYFVNRTSGTVDLAGGTLVAYKVKPDFDFFDTATYDAPSLAAGGGATTTVTVTGARVGDIAMFSMGVNQAGVVGFATVSADDTVSIRFQNESGGVVDLASTTIRVGVFKRHKKL